MSVTKTLGVNIITRERTHLFYLLFEFYPSVCFISPFRDLEDSIPPGPPFAYVLFVKYTISCQI